MMELVTSLGELAAAILSVLKAVVVVLTPLLPIIAWTAFWYFAVDWPRLRSLLGLGGWFVPAVAAGFAVVIRVTTSVEQADTMPFGPATRSPMVATIAWASLLTALALVAGAAQVSRANRVQ